MSLLADNVRVGDLHGRTWSLRANRSESAPGDVPLFYYCAVASVLVLASARVDARSPGEVDEFDFRARYVADSGELFVSAHNVHRVFVKHASRSFEALSQDMPSEILNFFSTSSVIAISVDGRVANWRVGTIGSDLAFGDFEVTLLRKFNDIATVHTCNGPSSLLTCVVPEPSGMMMFGVLTLCGLLRTTPSEMRTGMS